MPRAANEGVVGRRTVRNFDFLYALSRCKEPKEKWQILRSANRNQLLSIVDIASNILCENFKLTKKEGKRLEQYVEFLQKLARAKTEKSVRKLVLKGEGIRLLRRPKIGGQQKGDGVVVQEGRGGFLPALLIPILVELAATAKDEILKRI